MMIIYNISKIEANNSYKLTQEIIGEEIIHFIGTKQECKEMYDKNFDRPAYVVLRYL